MESNQSAYLLIALLGLAFLLSFLMGFRRIFRLQQLSRSRVINGFILAMLVLTILTAVHWMGYFPQEIAAKFTMFLYTLAAGFFSGFAIKMVSLRRKAKNIEYAYRSFWTEAAPAMIAILLIAFGIYRTGVLTLGPFTGIGITSGLSLIGFGLFGFTLNIVPEFRYRGILILDQFVPWKKVVAYNWHSENALQIEYLTPDKKLTDFTTYIPPEDEIIIERLLAKKLKEHEKERKKVLSKEDKTV
ncbi:MAG TPA: hypothetical protein VF181_02125 [Balneolaceae bacterium]